MHTLLSMSADINEANNNQSNFRRISYSNTLVKFLFSQNVIIPWFICRVTFFALIIVWTGVWFVGNRWFIIPAQWIEEIVSFSSTNDKDEKPAIDIFLVSEFHFPEIILSSGIPLSYLMDIPAKWRNDDWCSQSYINIYSLWRSGGALNVITEGPIQGWLNPEARKFPEPSVLIVWEASFRHANMRYWTDICGNRLEKITKSGSERVTPRLGFIRRNDRNWKEGNYKQTEDLFLITFWIGVTYEKYVSFSSQKSADEIDWPRLWIDRLHHMRK